MKLTFSNLYTNNLVYKENIDIKSCINYYTLILGFNFLDNLYKKYYCNRMERLNYLLDSKNEIVISNDNISNSKDIELKVYTTYEKLLDKSYKNSNKLSLNKVNGYKSIEIKPFNNLFISTKEKYTNNI